MENSQIEGEDTRIQETEKEVIICDDESLMKYLVEVTEMLLESIWKSSRIVQPRLCPLNDYLRHVIQQSKISLYTLKCAMIYFVRLSRQLQDKKWETKVRLYCGRRMFLGSVIIASKYLYDRTYSNSMWARLLGLDIKEVNNIQMDFLEALNYDLYITKELDCLWSQMLENFISYLKVKNEENLNTEKKSELERSNKKKDVLASPVSSPVMPMKISDSSAIQGMYKNFPSSPVSPASSVKSVNSLESDENIKSLKLRIMENQEIENPKEYQVNMEIKEEKRLEEYRPFIKVLIQVIFMYSKNNQLPIGEKKIIELPRLATTPDLLFLNQETMRMNDYANMYRSKNAFLQLKHCLKTSKNISKTKKMQLNRYFFNKMFPNRHNYCSLPHEYNSGNIVRHSSTLKLGKQYLNYDKDEEDKSFHEEPLKTNINLLNNNRNQEYNESNTISTSSSSEWDSMSDDSFTLIGSSESEDNSIDDINEDYTPLYDNEPFFDHINSLSNYRKIEKNDHHFKNSITITPHQDNEIELSSKILLPSKPRCNLPTSNMKLLRHPKIIYPKKH